MYWVGGAFYEKQKEYNGSFRVSVVEGNTQPNTETFSSRLLFILNKYKEYTESDLPLFLSMSKESQLCNGPVIVSFKHKSKFIR